MIHRNLRDILRKHNKRIFILCIKSLCCADGSGLPRFSLWWLFPSHPNFASYDLVNLVHLPLLDMFSDESQCLWRFCCIRPRDFVRADFWVNCLRQLASFLLCVSADWLHTSKQARKAPKLTGKLPPGRSQPPWQAVKSVQFFVSGKFGQNLQNDPWGNCILRPCNHTKLFRGSYSNCTNAKCQ